MATNIPRQSNDLKAYPFNLDFLVMDIRLQRNAFEEFDSMATNTEAKRAHLDSTVPLTSPPNPNLKIISGEGLVRAASLSAIEMAHPVYRLQNIVFINTIIEKLTQEFFTKLFLRHPHRMHDYLHPAQANAPTGYVKLGEIVEHSKQQLINKLAELSSKRVADLPITKVLKILVAFSGYAPDTKLFAELTALSTLRNKIVHEGYSPIIQRDQIIEAFDTAEAFAIYCGSALEHSGVIVRWPSFIPRGPSK